MNALSIYQTSGAFDMFVFTRAQLFGKDYPPLKRTKNPNLSKSKIFFAARRRLLIPIKQDAEYLKKSVYDLDLKPRAYKYFRHLKIKTVEDLIKYSREDFIQLRNCGVNTVNDIERELKYHGFSLKK